MVELAVEVVEAVQVVEEQVSDFPPRRGFGTHLQPLARAAMEQPEMRQFSAPAEAPPAEVGLLAETL
jgi:hypothetical protein